MRVGYVGLPRHSFSSGLLWMGNMESIVLTCVLNSLLSMKRIRAISDLVQAWYFSFGRFGDPKP